jgi:branched-chain amino acid transport system ATP-binding protein
MTLAVGEVLALLGPNGSGKSSVLKGIAGTARAQGTIVMAGKDISRQPPHRRVRDGIALVPQGRGLFANMTVEENLLVSLRKGRDIRKSRLAEVWEHFPQLRERQGTRAGYLSGGEQQMLAIGRALMSHPKLLLLDEPSLGLSPLMVATIFEKLREIIAATVSVIIVDQNAIQAMALADYVYVVRRGAIDYSAPKATAERELKLIDAHI